MSVNDSLPADLRNQSVVTFTSGSASGFSYSNVVNTIVNGPLIAIVKSALSSSAALSLPVTFQLRVTNTGNRSAAVTVVDPLPAGTVFVANSILVNGTPVPGIAPGTGVPVGELNAGSAVTIIFQSIVTAVPLSGFIENQAIADYSFVTLDHRLITGSVRSNAVSVPVASMAVGLRKSVSNAITFVGDMIAYELLAVNESHEALQQCVLIDPLPEGTGFVPGSVTAGGMRNPSASPAMGIPLGTIEPGMSKRVTFQAVVLDAPVNARLTNQGELHYLYGEYAQTALSNPATVIVSGPDLEATLVVEPTLATIAEQLTYTVFITNAGTIETNVSLRQLIPQGTTFVAGSIYLNGRRLADADARTELYLGSLPPGRSLSLVYGVVVMRDAMHAAMTAIPNNALVAYDFRLPNGLAVMDTITTNTAVVRLIYPDIGVRLQADPPIVEGGGTFLVRARVANTGNTDAEVELFDLIPPETSLVPGSAYVGGAAIPRASSESVPLGIVPAGGSTLAAYRLRVEPFPLQSRIRLRIRAVYAYAVNREHTGISVFSNEVSVRIESDDE